MRNLDARIRRLTVVILLAAVMVGWFNLVALAAAHIHPWAGLATLIVGCAIPFIPIRKSGPESEES